MVLGFKEQFKEKILFGSKIHTIRFDNKNRWRIGNKIHFATGVRTKNYSQFMSGTVHATQEILIVRPDPHGFEIFVDGKPISVFSCVDLAKNDGFDSLDAFMEWFLPMKDCSFKYGKHECLAKLIHWTPLAY